MNIIKLDDFEFFVLVSEDESEFLASGNWWVNTIKSAHFYFTLQGAKAGLTRFRKHVEAGRDSQGNLPPWHVNGPEDAKIKKIIIPQYIMADI